MVDAGVVDSLSASDAAVVAIAVIFCVVGIVVLLAVLMQRRERERSGPASGWHQRMTEVCSSGREVVDLTAAREGTRPGHGLSADQLSEIESKLDLFLAQIRDAQPSAPGPEDARRLRLAALHAESLNDAIRTERRVRLKSARSTAEEFETLDLQIASERSSLDDTLREISKELGAAND